MITIDEMAALLNEVAEGFPKELFRELNGGVVLLPGEKAGAADGLYVLGEYRRGGGLGRYIAVFYGSFIRVYGHFSRSRMKSRLKETLKHELTHHIESLAGTRSMEIDDEKRIAEYLRGQKRGPT